MQHEPSRLLRDADVASERGAGNTLLVRGQQPDRHKPLPQRNLAVFEDGADPDAEPLATLGTLVGPPVRERVDLATVTMRTEGARLPPDRGEVGDGRIFVGDRVHEFGKSVEIGHAMFL